MSEFKEGFSPEKVKLKEEYSKEELMQEIDKLDVEIAELLVQADAQKDLLGKIIKIEERSALENVISETEIKIKGKQNTQDSLRIRVGEMAIKEEVKSREN